MENCVIDDYFLYHGNNIIDASRYDTIRKGHESDYDTFPFIELFLELSSVGIGSIVFIGDSTTQGLFRQVRFEISRSNIKCIEFESRIFEYQSIHLNEHSAIVGCTVNTDSVFLKAKDFYPHLHPKTTTLQILLVMHDLQFKDFNAFFQREFNHPIAVMINFGLHF